jgi:hypothetical protein
VSGLGVLPWAPGEFEAYERQLEAAGWWVDHCAHCDRSDRHPSCRILPIEGVEQRPVPKWAPKTLPAPGEGR